MKFGPRIAARTSPALALLLVAFLAGWAFAQSASVYGPSGAYMAKAQRRGESAATTPSVE